MLADIKQLKEQIHYIQAYLQERSHRVEMKPKSPWIDETQTLPWKSENDRIGKDNNYNDNFKIWCRDLK